MHAATVENPRPGSSGLSGAPAFMVARPTSRLLEMLRRNESGLDAMWTGMLSATLGMLDTVAQAKELQFQRFGGVAAREGDPIKEIVDVLKPAVELVRGGLERLKPLVTRSVAARIDQCLRPIGPPATPPPPRS